MHFGKAQTAQTLRPAMKAFFIDQLQRFIQQIPDSSHVESVVDIAKTFTPMGKVHFVHLRNVKHESETDFHESAHLSSCGDLDMFAIVKALYENGFDGYIRPDHGRMIWGEVGRPGYGLYDRALGAAYINGLWEAVSKLL